MFVYIQNCADEQKLFAQMHKILEEDEENKKYGVKRMQIALGQRGIKRSLSTIRRAMVRGNLLHEDRRSSDGLTKADCNHLVKNIHPCTFLTASFCSVPPRRAGVLSRNDVLQKTSLCKTREAIYNTDVVNWHTRFCLEPPASDVEMIDRDGNAPAMWKAPANEQ